MASKPVVTRGRPVSKVVRRPAVAKPVQDAVPGFQRPPKLYSLEFMEGTELHGLVVKFRPLRYGDALERNVTLDWLAEDVEPVDWMAGMRRTAEAMASVLHSWNALDDDGAPVPTTFEGLCSLDQDMATSIVVGWALRVIGVSSPLDERSASGETSPELSIPMEPSSPSLAN